MFGNNLKKYRQKNGYSQSELANKLHVTRQCISKWEKGVTQPDLETLTRISELLDVSVDTLLKNDDSPTDDIPMVKAEIELNRECLVYNLLVALFCAFALMSLWRCLPSTVPLHWTDGEIDRYSDSTEILLLLVGPICFLIIDAILFGALRKAIQNDSALYAYHVIIIITQGVLIICQIAYLAYIIAIYAEYLTNELSFTICLSASLLLCVSIAMHPKITKQNHLLGIRTRETLSNEIVWNKTNTLACYLCSGVSLAIIIVNWFINSVWACIGLAAYVIPAVIAVIYSKHISKVTTEENQSDATV